MQLLQQLYFALEAAYTTWHCEDPTEDNINALHQYCLTAFSLFKIIGSRIGDNFEREKVIELLNCSFDFRNLGYSINHDTSKFNLFEYEPDLTFVLNHYLFNMCIQCS